MTLGTAKNGFNGEVGLERFALLMIYRGKFGTTKSGPNIAVVLIGGLTVYDNMTL